MYNTVYLFRVFCHFNLLSGEKEKIIFYIYTIKYGLTISKDKQRFKKVIKNHVELYEELVKNSLRNDNFFKFKSMYGNN